MGSVRDINVSAAASRRCLRQIRKLAITSTARPAGIHSTVESVGGRVGGTGSEGAWVALGFVGVAVLGVSELGVVVLGVAVFGAGVGGGSTQQISFGFGQSDGLCTGVGQVTTQSLSLPSKLQSPLAEATPMKAFACSSSRRRRRSVFGIGVRTQLC